MPPAPPGRLTTRREARRQPHAIAGRDQSQIGRPLRTRQRRRPLLPPPAAPPRPPRPREEAQTQRISADAAVPPLGRRPVRHAALGVPWRLTRRRPTPFSPARPSFFPAPCLFLSRSSLSPPLFSTLPPAHHPSLHGSFSPSPGSPLSFSCWKVGNFPFQLSTRRIREPHPLCPLSEEKDSTSVLFYLNGRYLRPRHRPRCTTTRGDFLEENSDVYKETRTA